MERNFTLTGLNFQHPMLQPPPTKVAAKDHRLDSRCQRTQKQLFEFTIYLFIPHKNKA